MECIYDPLTRFLSGNVSRGGGQNLAMKNMWGGGGGGGASLKHRL